MTQVHAERIAHTAAQQAAEQALALGQEHAAEVEQLRTAARAAHEAELVARAEFQDMVQNVNRLLHNERWLTRPEPSITVGTAFAQLGMGLAQIAVGGIPAVARLAWRAFGL